MTTKSETFLSNLLRKRADYRPGKTRKQRKEQYQQQILALIVVLVATVIGGFLVMYINYNGTGIANPVNCENYPEYCVPFAGGATGSDQVEADGSRELDRDVTASDGVVRGIRAGTNRAFIGNPDAPIHFWMVASFTCSHCQDYHDGDFQSFLDNYILTGQATFEYSSYSGVGGYPASHAMLGALCAGEQGAFWEFSDEMYRLARTMSPERAYSTSRLAQAAEELGLDDGDLRSCLRSNTYGDWVDGYDLQAQDYGVSGTPTVFVSYDGVQWQRVGTPSYSNLVTMTQAANNR